MAPFAAPSESSLRYLSIGNVESCTAQAFLLQLGIGFVSYNACLSLYYLLTIRYSISKERMIWREWVMHIACLLWALGAAIIPVPVELYNELSVGSGCWIGQFPQFCYADENIECIRGGTVDARIYGYILAGIPAFVSPILVIVSNTLVYRAAKGAEVKARRYSIGSPLTRQGKRTTAIAGQATWYVTIFVNSMFWSLMLRNLDGFDVITDENESSWTVMILLSQFFTSSAGFGFLLVYVRPRYLRHRARNKSRAGAVAAALSFRITAGQRNSAANAASVKSRHDNVYASQSYAPSAGGRNSQQSGEDCDEAAEAPRRGRRPSIGEDGTELHHREEQRCPSVLAEDCEDAVEAHSLAQRHSNEDEPMAST